MIDLAAVRARLRDLVPPGGALPNRYFTSVSDALSAADANDNLDANPPAAFVYISSERAEPNAFASGGRRQRVNCQLAVLVVLGAERASRERTDPLEVARGIVMASITGWKPPGAIKSCDYAGWRIVRLGDGQIWGEALFSTAWTISAAT